MPNSKISQKQKQKQKYLNLGPKMPYMGIFGLFFSKNYCHIWNQHLWICLNAEFREKMKMSKFGTKNALFRYFWARIFNPLMPGGNKKVTHT